ncbi:DMT family transporter [Bosea sp. 117]|uniref:DMT family transporter n=1 Tax=Bosea sp. 117 TaxID=1125973 RepID=UPI0004948712|nr:DMT family transporter [Bosea sp. 117]
MSPPPPASLAIASASVSDSIALPAIVSEQVEALRRRQAFVALLWAALCIGFSAIFVRLSDVGPAAIGFWRLVFALGPTALWAYAEHRAMAADAKPGQRMVPFTARQFALSTLAGLFFAADLVAFHVGLAQTATANALLIGNMSPAFIMLLGWMMLGERPTLGVVAALALGLAGTTVIVLSSATGGTAGASTIGDLLCLLAAGFYATYVLAVRVMRRGAKPLGGGMVSFLSSATGAVFCLIWAVAAGETIIPASLGGLLAVAGLGIVTHAAGQGLATFALGRLPASLVSVVLLLQILVGIALAALLFGEWPSLAVLVGGGLIVAGVAAVRPH